MWGRGGKEASHTHGDGQPPLRVDLPRWTTFLDFVYAAEESTLNFLLPHAEHIRESAVG